MVEKPSDTPTPEEPEKESEEGEKPLADIEIPTFIRKEEEGAGKPEKEPPAGVEAAEKEERLEKYGKSFEIRERLHQLEKTRADLVVLENDFNKRNSFHIKLLEKVDPESRLTIKEVEKNYKETLEDYEQKRAEYIGAKAWRMLKERKRVAEEEAIEHQEDFFEKFREKWRWLGEQNLDNFLSKRGKQPKGKFTKFAARMVSLRTAASLGLLGGGMVIGFGSATGLGLLAARRVMGGTGVAFGSYDLMNLASGKAALGVDKEKMEDMPPNELEEKMAEFEARAKFSGERIVRSPEYLALRQEYNKKFKTGEEEKITTTLWFLDEILRKKKIETAKGEKQRKVAAVGIGLFSIGAFSASGIAKLLEGKPEFAGVTPEQIQEAVREGPIATTEQVQDSIETEIPADTTRVIPEADSLAAEAPLADITPEPEAEVPVAEKVPKAPEVEAPVPEQTLEAETIEAAAERLDQTDRYIETIREGGSVWNATRRLVENGTITEEQFKEALENPASMAALPSGSEVHITELHLVHEGDQVIYVPGEGETPGHFEVGDYTEDEFNFGDARDLAEAMKREGHWGHRAHEWLYDKLNEYPEGYTPTSNLEVPSVDLSQNPELQNLLTELDEEVTEVAGLVPEGVTPPDEALRQATEGTLKMAEQEINLKWGTARFIFDENGRIADVLIKETLSPARHTELVNQASEQFLKPDYQSAIGQYMPETMQGFKSVQIGQAKEFAWQVSRLNQLLESFDSGSREAAFIRYKIQSIIKNGGFTVGARIFKPLNF